MRLTAGRSRLLKGIGILLAVTIGPAAFSGGGWSPEHEAHAIIGRPLTPMSYAGVARRTARRTAYVAATAPRVAPITVLPSGCANTMIGGVLTYSCAGVYYRPYYSGPTVVYQVVPPP